MPPNAVFANHLKVIGKIPFIATYIFKVRRLIIDGRMSCFADKIKGQKQNHIFQTYTDNTGKKQNRKEVWKELVMTHWPLETAIIIIEHMLYLL